MLSVDRLSIEFPRPRGGFVQVLHEVSFELAAGEAVGIVGESGSGKTVTARAIAGLLGAHARVQGEITFEGRTLRHGGNAFAGRDSISYIFQNPRAALDPVFTVGSQLVETLMTHGVKSRAAAVEGAIELLQAVGIPEPAKRMVEFPHAFSGGMAQRVMIALSLASNPRLLIADEPTSALDVSIRAQIIRLLSEIHRKKNAGLIFISHDIGSVLELCSRLLVMLKGRIVEAGPADQILASPQHDYTRLLIDAIPKLASAKAVAAVTEGGHDDRHLRIENLSVTFPLRRKLLSLKKDFVRAVTNVSIDVPPGRIVGIVGESGSGKSTIIRSVMGLNRPESGRIALGKQELTGLKGAERRRFRKKRRLQMIWQDPGGSLDPRHTVATILMRASAAELSPEKRRLEAERILDAVGLPRAVWEKRSGQLSGGQNQRVAIARALLGKPDILVADEPTSALDVSTQAAIGDYLKKMNAETGVSCILVSHDLGFVGGIAHDVVVLYLGQVMERGPSSVVLGKPVHPYTAALLASMPKLEPGRRDAEPFALEGEIPSPVNPPSGCVFRTRCEFADDLCRTTRPEPRTVEAREVACHFAGKLSGGVFDRAPSQIEKVA